jgi:hypothetical protein
LPGSEANHPRPTIAAHLIQNAITQSFNAVADESRSFEQNSAFDHAKKEQIRGRAFFNVLSSRHA